MNDHEHQQSLVSKSNQSSNHHSDLIYLDCVHSRVYVLAGLSRLPVTHSRINHSTKISLSLPISNRPDGGKGGAQAPRAEDDDGGRHGSRGRGLYGERGKGMKQGGAGGDTGLPLPVRSPRDGTAKRIVERTTGEGREKERVQRDLAGRDEVPSKRRRVVPASRTYSANLRIHEDERASERANLGVRLPLEADIRTIEEPEANIHDKRPEINDPLKRS
ncbi:hypothetical protein G5I_00900 [Acromyrmex echinatior]|uniref:Uncharacterized protein n=1 Tax=Acromyrmex echinatior TaxID=103372 RepID=F4W6R7_ACREC|nr:hypothetical protein G5I_00900 [Acromyrmex echinatior]